MLSTFSSIFLSSMCNLFIYIALQIHLEGILILDHIPYRCSVDITGTIQWETSVIYRVDLRE